MQNFPTQPHTSISLELNLPKLDWAATISKKSNTPATWFAQHFPDQANQYGCPFLEMTTISDGFSHVTPVSINLDFFAAMLGGDAKLGHSVVYFEPEMQFYYREPVENMYKPTSQEKLQNYYRAMLLRCAQELREDTDLLNLFVEFRSDKNAKAVVQRAKSVLAADSSFFSATSKHQRIKGIELHERIARKFVEELLTAAPGNVLLLADAYAAFLKLVKEQNLEPIKRPDFKAMVSPFVQEKFAICLRNDLVIDERSGVRGWKNVGFNQTVPA